MTGLSGHFEPLLRPNSCLMEVVGSTMYYVLVLVLNSIPRDNYTKYHLIQSLNAALVG